MAAGAFLGSSFTMLILWAGAFEGPGHQNGYRASDPASGSIRLTVGRFADSAYAPYRKTLRPDELRAWRRLARRLEADPKRSPTSIRRRAVDRLVTRGLDSAVTALEEAVREAPGEATFLSDLSALYGERARAEKQPEDFVEALEMAERAVSAAPGLADAHFNRALALEDLFLYPEAEEAWLHVLEMDGRSSWAQEARAHLVRLRKLATLRRPLERRSLLLQSIAAAGDMAVAKPAAARLDAEESAAAVRPPARSEMLLQSIEAADDAAVERVAAEEPSVARETFEERLLSAWADAVARGDVQRARRLQEGARRIADSLATRSGETIFRKMAAELSAAAAMSPGRGKRALLVRSLRQLGAGQEALWSFDDMKAGPELRAAELGLRSIASAMALTAAGRLAVCQSFRGDYEDARTTLERLGKDPRLTDYPSLAARRQWALGLIARESGFPSRAISHYLHALDLFAALHDPRSTVTIQGGVADILKSLGQAREAWRYRYSALALAVTANLPLYEVLDQAVLAALDQRRPGVALDFQIDLTAVATAVQPEEYVSNLLRLARIEAILGKQEAARRDFQRAIDVLPRVMPLSRERLAADIDVAGSEIEASGNRAVALARELRARAEIDLLVPGPARLSERADFDLRFNDTAAATGHLEHALRELERQRARVSSADYRVSFLDQAEPLYERMAALQLYLGLPERALEVIEQFRARALLDQLQDLSARNGGGGAHAKGSSASPLRSVELRRRTPASTAIVVYAVIEGRLVTWLIQSSGIRLSPQQPQWTEVASLVQRLRGARLEEGKSMRTLLESLFQVLIAPFKRDLHADRIVFVPTQSLYEVPFAALLDRATGRYLVQDYAIGVAPSASEFLAALDRDRQVSAAPLASVLLVGDPDRDEASSLPTLTGARREIALLSQIYRGLKTRVLSRQEATPARILDAMGAFDVVHFAVHGIRDPRDPSRSSLVLSSDESQDGELVARDVLRLRLSRTRLVVLASCDTQAGPVSASEGALSLASSFLAAGVPEVMGSLWPVDDEHTTRLSARFHEELRRGVDALAALQAAQLAQMKDSQARPDWTWASFQLFGGAMERSSASAIPCCSPRSHGGAHRRPA